MSETPAENMPRIGGILLAAGGSSRMGRPKQLLVYDGKTLLRRAAETLIASTCDPVVVVLGAEFENAKNEIEDLSVQTVLNENWQLGMSSSIKTGLEHLLQVQPDISAIVITLCDQPNIASSHIDQLTTKFCKTGSEIVAAGYNGIVGVPALFSRNLFDELSKLEGDQGARALIRNRENVVMIYLKEAAVDLDVPQDLEAPLALRNFRGK
jgi:molybdenum cofactor cytidylyltransferase